MSLVADVFRDRCGHVFQILSGDFLLYFLLAAHALAPLTLSAARCQECRFALNMIA